MSITIKEKGGLKKNILLLQGYPKVVRKEVAAVAYQRLQPVFERSQQLVPVDEGELKASGQVFETESGAKIRYTADHAARIEYDTTLNHPNGGQAFFVGEPFQELKKDIKQELAKAAAAPLKK